MASVDQMTKAEVAAMIAATLDEAVEWEIYANRPPVIDLESEKAIADRFKGFIRRKPGPVGTIRIELRYE